MRSPVNAGYLCPFSDSACIKLNHESTAPMPVCSVYRRGRKGDGSPQDRAPICVCPVRFFEADIVNDIVRECWVGPKPQTTRVAYEVNMEKFGNVDLVIADVNETANRVTNFLPVELQAVDITGSYLPYFDALLESRSASAKKSYGFNWANVRKRFISQLITKGFYCHTWETRIVAVIQEDLFKTFEAHAAIPETKLADANIVFMLYQFERDTVGGPWTLRLSRVVPTTHNMMMSSILYEKPPSRAKFEQKVLDRLRM